jgi:hypothetical protein
MQNNLATLQTDDGWGDAAAENAERVIKGTLLKFSDWRWLKGKEGTEVEKGTTLVALGTAAAWVKWASGKPVEYRMRQEGRRLSDREELGDLDETQWELGPDGGLKDPWQNTRFVYLVDPVTAEAYTFSTSSWGGRQAVADLGEQKQRVRYGQPGAVPVVELDAVPMQTKYGRKSKPFFKVIGWKGGELGSGDDVPQIGGAPPAAVPFVESAPATASFAEGATAVALNATANAFDDEIPF